jgi:hypothetical protein
MLLGKALDLAQGRFGARGVRIDDDQHGRFAHDGHLTEQCCIEAL